MDDQRLLSTGFKQTLFFKKTVAFLKARLLQGKAFPHCYLLYWSWSELYLSEFIAVDFIFALET